MKRTYAELTGGTCGVGNPDKDSPQQTIVQVEYPLVHHSIDRVVTICERFVTEVRSGVGAGQPAVRTVEFCETPPECKPRDNGIGSFVIVGGHYR